MAIGTIRAGARHAVARVQRWYPVWLVLQVVHGFSRNQGATYAAALAYYALLSFFPFLILLASIAGLIIGDPETRGRVVQFVIAQVPQAASLGDQIEQTIAELAGTRGGLFGVIGLAGSLLAASQVVGGLRRALNDVFEVRQGRRYLHGRLIDVLTVLGLMVLAVVWTALGIVVSILSVIPRRLGLELSWLPAGWVLWLVSFAFTWALAILAFSVLPSARPRWRALAIGAGVAAVGIEAVRAGFGAYVTRFGRYDVVYGTLGGVVAFLVFVYFVAMVALLGAQLAAVLSQGRTGSEPHGARAMHSPPAG